ALIRDAYRGPEFPGRATPSEASRQKRRKPRETFSLSDDRDKQLSPHSGDENEPSDACLDLLARLLSYDPSGRPTVEEALCHPFFVQHEEQSRRNEVLKDADPETAALFAELDASVHALERQTFTGAVDREDEEEERYLKEGLAGRPNL
ncbi:Tyrosine kinase-like (TKL) protein, partial [Toxoplasma gondii ARI]